MIIKEINDKFLLNVTHKEEITNWLYPFNDLLDKFDYEAGTTLNLQMSSEDGCTYKLISEKMQNGGYALELIKSSKGYELYVAILPSNIRFASKVEEYNKDKIVATTSEEIQYEMEDSNQGFKRFYTQEKINYTTTCSGEFMVAQEKQSKKSTFIVNNNEVVETSKHGLTTVVEKSKQKMRCLQDHLYHYVRSEDPTLVIVEAENEKFVSRVTSSFIPSYETLSKHKVVVKTDTNKTLIKK